MMRHELPKFETEEEEAQFWDTHSAADYVDDTTRVDVDVIGARASRRLRLEQVSISVPEYVMARARRQAERLGISVDRLLRRCLDDVVYGPAARPHRRKRRHGLRK